MKAARVKSTRPATWWLNATIRGRAPAAGSAWGASSTAVLYANHVDNESAKLVASTISEEPTGSAPFATKMREYRLLFIHSRHLISRRQ